MSRNDSELRESELRSTLDFLREGVQIISFEWRYLYVNDAVARQGRRRRDELLGRTMMECYPGIDDTPLFAALETCMRDRVCHSMENEFSYDSGDTGWFELRIEPCDEGLIILSVDITERKAIEKKLREAHKLRALGQMAGSIAHDLRNILNPISLQAQHLHRITGHDQKIHEIVVRIEEAIRTGAETVDRLRAFSRQEPEKTAEPTDLNQATESAIEICLPRIHSRTGVELRREIGPASFVLVRRAELVNGIVNLVMNAIEALPGSGTITVRTGLNGGGWVEVSDDGPGMPPEVKARVFEPFFTTKSEGTGLGLAMVYALVRRHDGEVTIDTAPGHGTTVRLSFSAAERLEREAGTPQRKQTRGRLLVVEDEPSALGALEALLQEEGFAVQGCASAEEGIERIAGHLPDGLLVDLYLPQMNGASFIRKAREMVGHVPAVLMTGADSSDVADLLREPRTSQIQKPVDLDALLELLAGVLGDRSDR